MTHDEMISVIEHHKKGGTVETRALRSPERWQVVPSPIWDFNYFEYRPKKVPVVVWGVIWHDGHMSPRFFDEREEAEVYADDMPPGRVVKMVEAVE